MTGRGNGATSTGQEARRCAVYTRKSTAAGLDQDFNSLDAQRESCEQYVRSRERDGWRLLPEAYEDGGFTGANMNRPGFQRLLDDIEAGRIDGVVVYKVDRLSRSLLDFAQVMERFNRAGAAFVSVTQNFSTADAMGRLTLNMLMSFAEFEREMIAERTRDKIAARSRTRPPWPAVSASAGPGSPSSSICSSSPRTFRRRSSSPRSHPAATRSPSTACARSCAPACGPGSGRSGRRPPPRDRSGPIQADPFRY